MHFLIMMEQKVTQMIIITLRQKIVEEELIIHNI